MPSDDRVPFPLDQEYVRERGSASSADVQVLPAAAEVPAQAKVRSFVTADARAPPPVAETSSASFRAPFAEAQASPFAASACLSVRFADPPVTGPSTPGPAEEEDDNGASVVSNPPVVDKSVARLATFIHDEYLESRPLSAPLLAPRCGFESLYALSEPSESTHPRFRLYPLVDEILADVCDLADTLAKTTKPLSTILPRCRRSHLMADVTDFTAPLMINTDFRGWLRTSSFRPSGRAQSPSLKWSGWRAPGALFWRPIRTSFGFSRVSCPSSSGTVLLHLTLRFSTLPFRPFLLPCRGRLGRPLP